MAKSGSNPKQESRWETPTMAEIGLDRFAPYLINRISARWNASIQEALRGTDLTTVRMRTLAVLSARPGATINELSVLAVIEQSTMSRNLDSMEAAGLIRRVPRADDLRVREIHVTPAGRRALDDFWPTMHAEYEKLIDGFSERERDQLISLLHKMLRNIRQHPI